MCVWGVLFCAFTPPASCETIVPAGNVSGTWLLSGSPYVIQSGNVTVPEGSRLKIAAGVRVEFRGHHKFIVNGHLNAAGLPTDSVIFTYTGTNPDLGWKGLRLIGADSTIFQFCRFDRGLSTNGTSSDSAGGAVYVSGTGSVVTFRNCEFSRNYAGTNGGALFAAPNSSVRCYDCVFRGNRARADGGAVFLNNAHGSRFERCEFDGNSCVKTGGAVHNRYANATFIDCQFTQNSSNVSGGALVANGPPSFRRCVFERNVSLGAQGGAVYLNDSTSTVSFDSCQFLYNRTLLRDAGAVYCWEASPRFSDCQFIGNESADDAGAIHSYRSGANPLFERCLFEHNISSDEGGALVISRYSRATLVDCTIRNNIARGRGGGGLYLRLLAVPTITNCLIEGNYCTFSGGGVHILSAVPTFIDCEIVGNRSDSLGGGVYAEGTGFSLVRTVISNNRARHGGGLALRQSSPTVSETRIQDNQATHLGGGIHLSASLVPITNALITGNYAGVSGGGVYADQSSPRLVHCTIATNRATTGHSLHSSATTAEITNCLLTNVTATGIGETPHPGAGISGVSSGWTIRNSLIYRVGSPDFSGELPPAVGTLTSVTANGDSCDGYGNVFLPPQFAQTSDEPYSLKTAPIGSPALNAGTPNLASVDILGMSRSASAAGLPDIGCYENSSAVSGNIMWGEQHGELHADTYRVYGDIIVPAGQALLLQSGVRLKFMGPFAVIVYGTLTCNGRESDSIFFSADTLQNLQSWRGIRFSGSESSQSWLKYTVIENCIAGSVDSSGGGVGCFSGASPLLTSCTIRNCRTSNSGGGLRVVQGSPSLVLCRIESCTAGTGGGGIQVLGAQQATLDSCRIERCSATTGGGISAESGSIMIGNSECFGNQAVDGGAIFLRNAVGNLSGLIINGSSASGSGGGVYASGSTINGVNLMMQGNSAIQGGAIYATDTGGSITHSTLRNNVGATTGGGACLIQCSIGFSRTLFASNSSGQGGGVWVIRGAPSFERCTIAFNDANQGAGFRLQDTQCRINSTQITDNQDGVYFSNSASAQVEYCNIFNNRSGDFRYVSDNEIHGPPNIGRRIDQNPLGTPSDIYSNIVANPQFVNPAGGNYSLLESSPCLDAADPSLGCDPDLSIADIGAFYTPHSSVEWIPSRLATSALESGELRLIWFRPQSPRLCGTDDLLYQIEECNTDGNWSPIDVVQDTSFVFLPQGPADVLMPLRVRSLIAE